MLVIVNVVAVVVVAVVAVVVVAVVVLVHNSSSSVNQISTPPLSNSSSFNEIRIEHI